jgi:phosphopantothenate-cysteine ligase/phosphopantothenoylcysteine decarboxylase/phosphopantothenate--cysteine ligase
VIHSAAVSDYEVGAVYMKNEAGELVPLNRSKKVDSSHDKLFLEMVQTPKIVDLIKSEWQFQGQLVKFKLQVGMSNIELLNIARRSMIHSHADFIVANCLEWSKKRAYVVDGITLKSTDVTRKELPEALWRRLI